MCKEKWGVSLTFKERQDKKECEVTGVLQTGSRYEQRHRYRTVLRTRRSVFLEWDSCSQAVVNKAREVDTRQDSRAWGQSCILYPGIQPVIVLCIGAWWMQSKILEKLIWQCVCTRGDKVSWVWWGIDLSKLIRLYIWNCRILFYVNYVSVRPTKKKNKDKDKDRNKVSIKNTGYKILNI